MDRKRFIYRGFRKNIEAGIKPLRISSANIANSTQTVDSVRCFDMQIAKNGTSPRPRPGFNYDIFIPLDSGIEGLMVCCLSAGTFSVSETVVFQLAYWPSLRTHASGMVFTSGS